MRRHRSPGVWEGRLPVREGQWEKNRGASAILSTMKINTFFKKKPRGCCEGNLATSIKCHEENIENKSLVSLLRSLSVEQVRERARCSEFRGGGGEGVESEQR